MWRTKEGVSTLIILLLICTVAIKQNQQATIIAAKRCRVEAAPVINEAIRFTSLPHSSRTKSQAWAENKAVFRKQRWFILLSLHVSLRSCEICDFQIESRKFESNRKSNPKAPNRIFYCQIESLIAVKSRFKSNRDWDLPTTASNIHCWLLHAF